MMKTPAKKVTIRIITVALLATILSSLMFHFSSLGITEPDFIELLQSGKLAEADVAAVKILKFDPGAGWPGSEAAYERKASITLSVAGRKAVIEQLRLASTKGLVHRNHPEGAYYGIMKIELQDGGYFYLYYRLGFYEGQYYVSIDANRLNDPNPNHTVAYENSILPVVLREFDPWYKSEEYVSPDGKRVNAPDDSP